MELSVLRTAELSNQQYAAVVELCSTVFEVNYQDFLDVIGPSTHVLCSEAGRLVSHAMWVSRRLRPGNLPILCTAYVEGVVTDPFLQGHGYATAVMQRLAGEIQDFELAGLATGRPGFYARLGWESWLGPTFVRTDAGLEPEPNPDIMILRLPKTPPVDVQWPLSCEWRRGEIW